MSLPKANNLGTRVLRRELPLINPECRDRELIAFVNQSTEYKMLHVYVRARQARILDVWKTSTVPKNLSILDLPYPCKWYHRALIQLPDGTTRKIYFYDKLGYWVRQ